MNQRRKKSKDNRICLDSKEKGVAISRNSLIFKALQDGLEPEYMKPTEIIRNYKKLNTNKLHKRIER
jgi:hypothetical protein